MPAIQIFDFATGELSRFAELEAGTHGQDYWFSVSPDERWILYTVGESESDIMLVENFR